MDETTDDEFEEKEIVFTRLKSLVREKYTSFLRKQLETNVNTWLHTNGRKRKLNGISQLHQFDEYIKAGVEMMEQKALHACMATQVYQRNMLKCIASVRRFTEQASLERHLHDLIDSTEPRMKKPKFSEIQTEDDRGDARTAMSLQEKIALFQGNFGGGPSNGLLVAKQETESGNSTPIFDRPAASSTPLATERADTATPPPADAKREVVDERDSIAEQLEELFREDKTEFDEIYEGPLDNEPEDPRMQSILDEIKMSQLNQSNNNNTNVDNDNDKAASEESTHSVYHTPEPQVYHRRRTKRSKSLRYSPWPCKLHMQRCRLKHYLMNLLQEDMRWQEIMSWKFQQLFGDDSDDEFTLNSPSMEMDEVVLSSCLHRISRWLVTHLMPALNEGLIGNRYLFKMLAKKLGRSIIQQNSYPNEEYIKRSVERFFCTRPSVMSLHDLADIIDL